MDGSETTVGSTLTLPPILRAEHASPPLARGPWYLTIGPAYLGLFVWAPFFDSLWSGDVTRYSLARLVAIAVFTSLLCFSLLYLRSGDLGIPNRSPARNRGGIHLWNGRFRVDHGGRGRCGLHRLVCRRH